MKASRAAAKQAAGIETLAAQVAALTEQLARVEAKLDVLAASSLPPAGGKKKQAQPAEVEHGDETAG